MSGRRDDPRGEDAATHNFDPIAVRISDAVRMIGLGRSKIYELIASGDIEIVKVGSCTLIPVASLRKLIAD